jgi:hypothetical protein
MSEPVVVAAAPVAEPEVPAVPKIDPKDLPKVLFSCLFVVSLSPMSFDVSLVCLLCLLNCFENRCRFRSC